MIRNSLANNYKTFHNRIIIKRAKDCILYDMKGNEYIDFISGYSSVNIGHCHNRLLQKIPLQINELCHTSRFIENPYTNSFSNFITTLFGYDKVLPMNSGVEAGETAVKLLRKYAHSRGISSSVSKILFPTGNFWGRSITACSTQDNKKDCFAPYTPGFDIVDYDNIQSLEKKLQDPTVIGYFMEPLQGEGGIIVPTQGYLKKVRELCDKYNKILIFDEIQCGLGRTGKLLTSYYEDVKPDILLLGKALSGGITPISCVLANDTIMSVMEPGSHGSTFGGNPLACSIAEETLKIILEENLSNRSFFLGNKLKKEIQDIEHEDIIDVRGLGLMIGIEFRTSFICDMFIEHMLDHNIIVNKTKEKIVRITPPLTIKETQLKYFIDVMKTFYIEKKDIMCFTL